MRLIHKSRLLARQLRGELTEEEIAQIALRPPYDRGGSISVYSGPSGPIVTLARVRQNVSHGRPAGEGIEHDLNDPSAP